LITAAPEWMFGVWLGNLLISLWKHRADLNQPAMLRPWALQLLHVT
jgi:hypothetical protein